MMRSGEQQQQQSSPAAAGHVQAAGNQAQATSIAEALYVGGL